MELEHAFTVPVGVEGAWSVLLDVERIAPCMPGAALTSVDGDAFTGTVKVRLGPIGLTYQGSARFTERDPVAHRAVIAAAGRDSRGSGTAKATVTAVLAPDGPAATRVEVHTDLAVTGKPAQFGRGVMADVGGRLIGQFADCLARTLAEGGPDDATDTPPADAPPAAAPAAAAPPPAAAPTPAPSGRPRPEPEPIDLLATAGLPPALRRAGPYLLGAVAGGLLVWTVGRLSR